LGEDCGEADFYIFTPMKTQTLLKSIFGMASIVTLLFTACEDKEKKQPTFKSVKIGKQTWMAENLNIDLPGSKCYDNNHFNCMKYGRLYNWETAKKACPKGWHLPSDGELMTLGEFIGGEKMAGKTLKASSGWNEDGNGTDNFGFSALPGGGLSNDDNFGGLGYVGSWWSSAEGDSIHAYFPSIYYDGDGVSYAHDLKSSLHSVRCLKD